MPDLKSGRHTSTWPLPPDVWFEGIRQMWTGVKLIVIGEGNEGEEEREKERREKGEKKRTKKGSQNLFIKNSAFNRNFLLSIRFFEDAKKNEENTSPNAPNRPRGS